MALSRHRGAVQVVGFSLFKPVCRLHSTGVPTYSSVTGQLMFTRLLPG